MGTAPAPSWRCEAQFRLGGIFVIRSSETTGGHRWWADAPHPPTPRHPPTPTTCAHTCGYRPRLQAGFAAPMAHDTVAGVPEGGVERLGNEVYWI